jgi:hypothetical protein
MDSSGQGVSAADIDVRSRLSVNASVLACGADAYHHEAVVIDDLTISLIE